MSGTTFRFDRGRTAAAAAAVGVWASLLTAQASPETLERRVYVMGTRATLVAAAPSHTLAMRSLNRMVDAIEGAERDLSTWRDTSLLSRLNRQPIADPWHAPVWFCELVGELGSWSRSTGGAFDPTVGSLVAAWGLRGRARHPDRAALESARAVAGFQHVAVDAEPCTVTRLADVSFDAGAFGKGAALDRVAALDESGLIDLGGQVAVYGPPPKGGWTVSIAHPEHRGQPAAVLRVTSGSVAVSGGSERDQWVAGEHVGHIVDPRTGAPVNRRLSVTVWHERALAADVLSTALYVLGPDVGFAWAEASGVAACFLIPTGKPLGTDAARVGPRSGVGPVELVTTAAFRRRFPQWRNADLRVAVDHRDQRVHDVKEREGCVGQGRDAECLSHEGAARIPGNQDRRQGARVFERP